MPSHSYRPGPVGLEAFPVKLWAKIAIGATGAPTLSRGKGITSVVRNSAGNYTLTLDCPYQLLLGFNARSMKASTGIPAAPVMTLVSEAVSTAAAPTVNFVCAAATDSATTTLVATDPGNGETLYLELTLSNSTAV